VLSLETQPSSLSVAVECTNNVYNEQAGLYAFLDERNWVKLVKEGAQQEGTTMVIFAYQIDGVPVISGKLELGSTTKVPRRTFLRLERMESLGSMVASVSIDGISWQQLLSNTGTRASAPLPTGQWRFAMVAHSFHDSQWVRFEEFGGD
jgi:hypothetical protein